VPKLFYRISCNNVTLTDSVIGQAQKYFLPNQLQDCHTVANMFCQVLQKCFLLSVTNMSLLHIYHNVTMLHPTPLQWKLRPPYSGN